MIARQVGTLLEGPFDHDDTIEVISQRGTTHVPTVVLLVSVLHTRHKRDSAALRALIWPSTRFAGNILYLTVTR